MLIPVELGEAPHVVPNFLIVGVKDMGSVRVDVDIRILEIVRVSVTADVLALLDELDAPSRFSRLLGKDRAEYAAADHEPIIHGCPLM